MSLVHLDDERKKGFPSHVYLLNYKDYFYLLEAIRLLRDYVDEEGRTFNFDVYDLDPGDGQASMAEIIDTLNMASLFAARRVICVKNFQKIKKADVNRMAKYVENPSPMSVLCLFSQLKDKGDKPSDKSHKTTVPFTLKTITLDFNERELNGWAQKKIASYGCTIAVEAVNFLKDLCGDSVSRFANELDKLTLLGRKEIGITDVEEAVFGTKGYTIFQVADAIGKGNKSAALAMYTKIRDGLDDTMVLGALNWQMERKMAPLRCFEQLNDVNKAVRSTNPNYPIEFLIYNLCAIFPQAR
ncbi:MAG: DNA polymerase III subunit delta [Nitrospirae bacterium]|nr:DNA polymerase III subunit delta [Nitrospirota bacterium]